jgi:hypothetical protein
MPSKTEGEKPDRPGHRLAVIEAMGAGKTENPQQITDDFAVCILRLNKLLIGVHEDLDSLR